MVTIETMTSEALFQNTIILRKPRAANFTGIIKIATMLINTTLRDSNKVKRNFVLKCNLYQYFLDITKFSDGPLKKC